jgi:hypothetical protein
VEALAAALHRMIYVLLTLAVLSSALTPKL